MLYLAINKAKVKLGMLTLEDFEGIPYDNQLSLCLSRFKKVFGDFNYAKIIGVNFYESSVGAPPEAVRLYLAKDCIGYYMYEKRPYKNHTNSFMYNNLNILRYLPELVGQWLMPCQKNEIKYKSFWITWELSK